MATVTLIIGGARSGKSRYALALAAKFRRKAFVATAEPCDDEMRERIERHRRERDPSFQTVEEPRELTRALKQLAQGTEVAVIDCLTVWLSNLFLSLPEGSPIPSSLESFPQVKAFVDLLRKPPCHLLVVTNELGMGIVPSDPQVRAFRDLAGWLHQEVAGRANRVILMMAGVPWEIKGGGE